MIREEIAILAQLVKATCDPCDTELFHSGGYSAPANAMLTLAEHGMIGNVTGCGRQISGKWVNTNWNWRDATNNLPSQQAVLDDIFFMFDQYIGIDCGKIEIRATSQPDGDPWKHALEYLEKIGVARITRRFQQYVNPDDLHLLKLQKVTEKDYYVFAAVDAHIADYDAFWRRRYP